MIARALLACVLALAAPLGATPSSTTNPTANPTPQSSNVPVVPQASNVPTASLPTSANAAVAQRTLSNGLRVVVVQDHAAAVVQTAIWYRFGSLDETPGKTGLAHGLEHMMFRGTRAVSGGGLDDIAARLGAEVNANTAEDFTHFYSVLPADELDLAIHLEADRMRGLLLRPADWALEKGAVLGEYDGDESQPVARLAETVRRALYAGSPYARTPLGVRADIVRSTAADLRRYYDAWYRPDEATLVVTGDVAPEAVFASARRWFGPLAAHGRAPVRAPATAPVAVPRAAVTIDGDYPYAVVDLGYRIPGDLDADAAATQVFANLVGSDRSAFHRALVDSKLTLSYQAYADTALRQGVFHVMLFVTLGRSPAAARRAFENALAQVRARGIDPELLAAAKTAFARQAVYARDAISGLGDRYGYAYGVEGRDPAVDDAAVAALDAGAMNRAVATYFGAPQTVGVLRPRRAHGAREDAKRDAAPAGATSDSFADRAPSGPVRYPGWVRAALRAPARPASRIAPRAYALANGLRLLVQPVRANPTVFVSGSIALSPAFDPPGRAGLGGLASSLVAYGGARYDYAAQRRVADDLGADIQPGASFTAHGLARDLGRMLDVLADGVRRAAFAPRYVSLVRDQELASISRRDANPDYRAERAFSELLYAPGDPALRQESAAGVRAIDRTALRTYAARYFRPDRTTIVIAGDVAPEAARAAVARAFGGWANAGARPNPTLPPLPRTRAATRRVPAERDAVSVRMGQRAPARTSPDFYAFNLLNGVLGAGGSFDTRLMHEVRERRGLVYGISSSLQSSRERGVFEIDFSAGPRNVAPALALARAEVRRLTREPVAAGELARAKRKLIAGTLVGEESTQTIVSRLENIAQNHLPNDYYATLSSRYDRIGPRRILAVARRYLRPDAFATVYEGPPAR
jgi:zinc protease